MIIVEGGDNVGKSTLIKKLVEMDPQLRVMHRDRFNPKQQETIATSYLRALMPLDGDRVAHSYGVADRFLASECIYGALFRNGCRMTPSEHWAVRLMLQSYCPIVVLCDPGDQTIMKTWTKREQLYDDPLIIAQAYRQRMPEIFGGFLSLTYDWTAPDAEKFREFIIEMHRRIQSERRRALSWWSTMPYGSGALESPNIILILDRFEPTRKVRTPLESGDDAEYLTKIIRRVATESNITEWRMRHIFVTHAYKEIAQHQDATLLREELNHLVGPQTTVITLGEQAKEMYESVAPTIMVRPNRVAALASLKFAQDYFDPDEYVRHFISALEGASTNS